MPTTRRPRGVAVGIGTGFVVSVIIALLVGWEQTRSGTPGAAEGARTGSIGGPGTSVVITGDAARAISPGSMVPLDLSLDNPNDFDLAVDRLAVTVSAVVAPLASADRPCSAADFEVRALAEGVELTLGADSVEDLSGLGVAREDWPAIGMVNSPVNNQNGCQGATLTLSYEASGVEVQG